jgi:putative aldouronate transport system substrate-binding protein
LEEIAEAFTHDDPDGNGAADTYGLYAFATPDGAMEVLYPWTFGLLGWQEYDGKYMDLKYSLDHDNFERALEFSNKMWKAGLVDPDWPTIQRTAADDRFKKGITGFRTEFAGHMLNNQKGGRELNPDYTLSYVTGITEKEGDPVIGGQYSTGYWGFWGVSSQAEKPERVVELLDYMLSDAIWDEVKYGPKGVTWEEQNGEKVSIWDPEKKTGNVFRNFIRRNDDPEFFLSLTLAPEERTRLGNLIDNCIKNFTFAKDRGYRPPIADDPKFIEYEKNMEVQITKIIVGDLPINDWKEKILPGWYEAGGEEYIKQMQEYIESQEK